MWSRFHCYETSTVIAKANIKLCFKDVSGTGGIGPRILNFDASGSGQLDAPTTFVPGTQYLVDRKLGRPQNLSEHCEEKTNLSSLHGM
jgi:hypothetical protein